MEQQSASESVQEIVSSKEKEIAAMKQRWVSKGVRNLVKDRKYHLKNYPNVIVGNELVEWLIKNGEAGTLEKAVALGQSLMDNEDLHHVTNDHPFKNEQLFYRFAEDDPEWQKASSVQDSDLKDFEAHCQKGGKVCKTNCDKHCHAVHGYDVVAYFTDAKPMKGKKEFSHQWNDGTWLFASQEHLDMFKADPEKYAPQYGGYCAWAVNLGTTADISANAWKIVDGKLYLNYNKIIKKVWQTVPNTIERADGNWPDMLKKAETK